MQTQRITNLELEKCLGMEFKVLDHGFVRVVDYMGDDKAIVEAARVSYGKGTSKTREDRTLIRYLMRHRHTTPFEMCEIKFHVKLPIFVARQWIRHRTANVNEYSARYSVLDNEFYVPEVPAEQSSSNKQGRGDAIAGIEGQQDLDLIRESSVDAYKKYLYLLNRDEEGNELSDDRSGLAREMARIVLPTNFYTQWYWKIDLHNLFHFLSLRADPHAQLEIRAYTEPIMAIVKLWVPFAFEAFQDYVLGGTRFSVAELALLKRNFGTTPFIQENPKLSDREWQEFIKKLEI